MSFKGDKGASELEESHGFLQTIIDGVGDPIMVIGSDYRVRLMNKAAKDISASQGLTLCHEISHNSIKPCSSKDHPCPLEEVKRTGEAVMVNHEHIGPGGETRHIEIMASPLLGKDGSFEGIIESSRDITDRKNAEEKLKDSESRFRGAFENAAVGASMVDLKGGFLRANHLLCDILGYSEEELLTKTFSDITHPDDIDIELTKMKNMIRGETDYTAFEKRYISKDGHEITILLSPALIRNEEGEPQYFVSLWQDITNTKKAQEALLESEEKFKNLFESATDAIFILDMKGNFIDINRAAHQRLGYTREEMLQMHISELDPPEYAEKVPERLADLQEKGQAVFESAHYYKDGRIMPVEINSRVLDHGGQKVYFSLIRDITERKAVEEELKLNSQMLEKSLQEKELLLKEVHHRVKNNLQIISSLLKLQSGYVDDEKSQEMFRESQDRVRSMALVHEELYQSKDFANINIKDYIKTLVHGLFRSYAINTSKINYTMDIGDVTFAIDTAIPCGLIINELVSNSLKHAFPGDREGQIDIVFRPGEGDQIELTVKDNGVGIPHGLDPTRCKTMGLQLVTTLAENQLHGTIDIKREGRGTEFTITFPSPKYKERS